MSEKDDDDGLLRRLRIDQIKERRRRFHKETAERWILEQQFGGGEVDNNEFSRRRGGGAPQQQQSQPDDRPDRNSFLNAFEFFAKNEGNKSDNNTAASPESRSCGNNTTTSERPTNKRVGLKLELDTVRRRSNDESQELNSSSTLYSPPPPTQHFSPDSSSSSSSTTTTTSPEEPVVGTSKPPDILVLDPIVIITDEPDQSHRRRPSSILKKRDSSTTDDNSGTGCSTTVSFATDIVEANESCSGGGGGGGSSIGCGSGAGCGGSGGEQLQEPYRRRSRSYSGSSTGRSLTGRRNSAEAQYYSSTEDFENNQASSRGILKHSCSSLSVDGNSDSEFKGILKQPRRCSLGSNIHTVHQARFSDEYEWGDRRSSSSSTSHRSILKRKTSTSSSQPDVSTTSSLRSTASSYCSSRESLHEPDPKPILKKKSSSEEISDSDYNSTSITPPPPRPILKNKAPPSSESIPILVSSDTPIKPCLKKPCKSFDESALWPSHNAALESTSSIMRKSSPHICSVKKCEEDDIRTYRRGSEPINSPTMEMEDNNTVSSRRGSETFYKRKIELGKIDFSHVYDKPTSSSSDTSPSSGISSPSSSTPTASSSSPKKSPGQGNSISQKIAALQISGESSWKKRISKPNPEVEIIDGLSDKNPDKKPQNGILANRLSMLESSQESWRKRVGEKDAKDFTVQGKLERAGKKVEVEGSGGSPTKKKSNSFKNVLRGMRGSKTDESISNCSTVAASPNNKNDESRNSPKNSLFQRSKSMRYGRVQPQQQQQEKEQQEKQSTSQHVTVAVIKNDNETFTSFFNSETSSKTKTGKFPVIVEDESFNAIIKPEGRQLLGSKRNVRVVRNNKGTRNPIKALAGRLQEQTYVDVNPEIRERDNIRRRIQMENSTSASHAHLSIEALAGLASKEDFTSVKLRRAQQEISAQYPYPLLIRVKGKRFVQSRLAAPELSSINSGDNFILVTQTKVYHFIGEYSNRMERSKSLDIVAHVIQKKEFGCNLHTKVITLQEDTSRGSTAWDSFFEVLGANEKRIRDTPELLGDQADEEYESRVISRNKVWRVITEDELDEKLEPLREYWGCVPKYKLLEPEQVLIFDFGPEMYVWAGSKAAVDKKRLGWKLAQELFEMEGMGKEFDDVCGGKDVNGRRPSWCWLRRVNQHMEPILFIEKFFDWPEEVGRIRVGKKEPDGKGKKTLEYAFVPALPESLSGAWEEEVKNVSLVLEGFDVKRGREIIDVQERRNYTITTSKLNAWAISEFSKSEVPESQLGHFNSYSTYVIRWQYTINFIGKDLKGNQSRHNCTTIGGRDRCAYFFWHGKKSKITEQGASALMTVELDDMEEKGGGGCSSRGPQIRVEQNYEPPAFLSLFQGKLFVHDNLENSLKSKQRLYVTLGTTEEEAHFMEVQCSTSSLRNNGCFLLLDLDHKVTYVWFGAASSSEIRKVALVGADATLRNPNWPSSITKVITVKQSNETDSFWSCFKNDAPNRVKVPTTTSSSSGNIVPIMMFRFTCLNGKFEGLPVVSPRRDDGGFPAVQEDLYGDNVSQPSMFMVMSQENVIYLWQGWRRTIKREYVPEDDDSSLHDSTPLTTMWPRYRRCSVESAISFSSFKSAKKCYLVYAGIEPPEFTHIFPYWDDSLPALKEAREYHLADGKCDHEKVLLSEVLQELNSKKTYTVEELMEKPDGVDLSRLEDYVSDEDFERLFSMPRVQFSQLQSWRKTELKKSVGLF